MNKPRVNIILVNYNSSKDTLACILSLVNSDYKQFQIFIVDNKSEQSEIDVLQEGLKAHHIDYKSLKKAELDKEVGKLTFSVILIENDENGGYAAGNNVALTFISEHRPEEFAWLINPDTQVEAEVLSDLTQLCREHQKAIVGNVMYDFNEPDKLIRYGGFKVNRRVHGITYISDKNEIAEMTAVSGASFFTRIRTFNDLGLLPEDYFMYWEETDFCSNALQQGYKLLVNTKSRVFDKGGTASNSSFLREYLYLLNGLRYYRKFMPRALPLIILSTIAKHVFAFFSGNWIKVRAIYYAHIDFIKLLFGREINVLQRIHNNTY